MTTDLILSQYFHSFVMVSAFCSLVAAIFSYKAGWIFFNKLTLVGVVAIFSVIVKHFLF